MTLNIAKDWMVGILSNIARIPIKQETGQEDPKLGLQMTKLDWYQVPFWGLIDHIDMLKPQKLTQVSVGWKNPKAIQVARYPLLVVFKGSNKVAEDLVWKALGFWQKWMPHKK